MLRILHYNEFGCFWFLQVALLYEDVRPEEGIGVGRKVLDKVHQTYTGELGGKDFAYDGEKSLFTIGQLPLNKHEFNVVLEDVTSNRSSFVCIFLSIVCLFLFSC